MSPDHGRGVTSDAGRNSGWIRRLLAYCWRSRRSVLLAISASLGAAGIAALTPLLVRQIVDEVILAGRQSLAPWLFLLVLAGVGTLAFSLADRWYSGRVGFDVEYTLRTNLFESLQFLDGAQQDRLRTGQLVSRATSDVSMVERLIVVAPLLAANLLQFAVSLLIMAVLSPTLTMVALAVTSLLFVVARRSSRSFFPATWDASQRQGEVAAVIEAAVTGVRVVKGFGQEHREQLKLERAAAVLFGSSMRVARLTVRYLPLFRNIPAVGQVGILAFGGYLTLNGSITLGTFLAFATYLGSMIGPMMLFANQLTQAQATKAAAVRIFEIIDAEPTLRDASDAREAPTGAVPIELRNVTFGYEPVNPVLRDVSLRLEPGETLALVGGTGSGKSTVALLLARFYDPWQGSIHLGSQDLRELSMASLRQRMGMVFEDSFLFSDTIRANIAFGRPDATDEDVVTAARAAEADAFIRTLSNGYDTVVGERGLTLSGGQRQRIALARAILAHPYVLVLDDATSAVDAGVEAEIHTTLHKVMRGRTTILIAHRRSTLQLADRIAVLHHGRVADVGTHEELLARCPRYRLLLTGHDAETDGIDSDDVADDLAQAEPDTSTTGFTPSLWSNPPEDDPVASGALGGEGLPPDQQAKVAALSPAIDSPDLDVEAARQPEPAFGLRRLWPPFRTGILVSTALVTVEAVAQLAIPWLTRSGIDQGVTRNAPGVLFAMCGLALAVVVLGWVVTSLNIRVVTRNGERLHYWLRVKMFAHLQRLGLDYYERERAGHVMTRLTTDIDSVREFVQRWVGELVVAALTFLGVVLALLLINVKLTLATLSLLPAFAVAIMVYRRTSTRAYEATRDQLSAVNANFQENIAGIRVAQAYGRQRRNVEIFHDLAATYRSLRMRALRKLALFVSFTELTHQVAMTIVLGVGAGLVAGRELTAGGIIAFTLYLTMLFSPIQMFSQVVDAYQRAKVGLRRIQDLLRTPSSTESPAEPVIAGRLTGLIEFDQVRFGYAAAVRKDAGTPGSSGEEALKGINLRIEPRETVAIVGETGAGKSTLVKLAARFYDPTSGVVRADGQDLRVFDSRAYRQRLGVVPQEAYLFNGSVRDVIAYGRPNASEADVERAARTVGAHQMIASLKHGYLHPVGERGHSLSAGQRQLLALARAELINPDILLLDEATASLDLATEAAVAAATSRLAERRTTLVIAHRLTTARAADRIVLIHDGEIAESGTHDQLVLAGGRYAELWRTFSDDEQSGTPTQLSTPS
ncbi:ABC transporter ATP-binding protein [Actinopolymorpha alba]|uniref:ABC transporter ATP-binding protein n=1 Tax=Actinopolymorpha alba TaxID=533267 RepID=UPI00039FCBD7|nr:ABC transporter ATP-binding protein [Actinopolymorpha alba]